MKCVICGLVPACNGEVFCETCVETLRPSGDVVGRNVFADVFGLNEVRRVPQNPGESPDSGGPRLPSRRHVAA